jgi:hypothetical protein
MIGDWLIGEDEKWKWRERERERERPRIGIFHGTSFKKKKRVELEEM